MAYIFCLKIPRTVCQIFVLVGKKKKSTKRKQWKNEKKVCTVYRSYDEEFLKPQKINPYYRIDFILGEH